MASSSCALALVDADPTATVSTTSDDYQWMSFVAGFLPAVHCGRSYTASHVDQMCDGIQVIGTDAAPNSTQVIQFGVLGDRSDKEFVGDSVGAEPTSPTGLFEITPDDAVASIVESSSPQPTGLGLVDLLPEPFNERDSSRSSHGYTVTTIQSDRKRS